MFPLLFKYTLPWAASSVLLVTLASCDREGKKPKEPAFEKPGLGPTKSTGTERPVDQPALPASPSSPNGTPPPAQPAPGTNPPPR